jgi:hypothetical protein
VDDPQQWKATAYAYMQARIPVLVAGLLNDHSGPAAPRSIGRHAIVLTGFSLGRPDAIKCGDIPITFTASRIDKFYAHDDQIGAFARMPCPDTKNRFSFETSWIGSTGRMTVQFVPETIFVPLYHKIRVPFSHVRSELLRFEATLESLRTLGLSASIPTIEWDVRLTYVNELKSTFAADAPAGPLRRDLLEARMPRFIWRARGLVAGVCHLDLLFDATGIEKGNCCFRVVEWVTNIGDVLRGIAAASPDACTALAAEPSWRVVRWIVGP